MAYAFPYNPTQLKLSPSFQAEILIFEQALPTFEASLNRKCLIIGHPPQLPTLIFLFMDVRGA